MHKNIIYSVIALFSVLISTSCDPFEVDEVLDPNNPSVAGVEENATRSQLQNLVFGLEARQRQYYGTTTYAFGSFGRELWAFFNSDPRFTSDWLGQNGVVPDASFFSVAATYEFPYRAINQANVIIAAVNNTSSVTPQEALGYAGFAKTIQGFQYLIPLNGQFENGIRIDVADEQNPGPFLSYDQALVEIRRVLDEGVQDLSGAGDAFAFELTSGFMNFNTPALMSQVNRAIAARAAIYAEDWQGALTALEGSFFDLAGDINTGPELVYGDPPDLINPLFFVLDADLSRVVVVHPSMIEDAEPGDLRVEEKFFLRSSPLSNVNIPVPGLYQDQRYESQSTNIPFIRNEELMLIYAEANAQLGNTAEAVNGINAVRSAANLPDYDGPTDLESLIDQILFERRYSLWAEGGHRWIDARRYDRLDEIPVELDEGAVFTQLERPLEELNWDEFTGN